MLFRRWQAGWRPFGYALDDMLVQAGWRGPKGKSDRTYTRDNISQALLNNKNRHALSHAWRNLDYSILYRIYTLQAPCPDASLRALCVGIMYSLHLILLALDVPAVVHSIPPRFTLGTWIAYRLQRNHIPS